MALAVAVLSPLLLDAPVRTSEQLRRVDALCRVCEVATLVRAQAGNHLAARPAGMVRTPRRPDGP